MRTIGIIGFGNMGEAIVQGLRQKYPDLGVLVIEKSPARLKLALEHYAATDLSEQVKRFCAESDCILLAVKPQDMHTVLTLLRNSVDSKSLKLISILAGKKIATIRDALGPQAQVARFMPNLAATVQKSVVGVSFTPEASSEFRTLALEVAQAIGFAIEVPEQQLAAITAISGSGIAWVYEFIHAMALGGTREGIAYQNSLAITLSVLEGAVASLRSTNIHPIEMVSRVCSPSGTTIEGINALEEKGFRAAVIEAIHRTNQRALELEQ